MFCPSVDPEDIRLDHLEWSPVSERSEQIEECCCDDTYTAAPRALMPLTQSSWTAMSSERQTRDIGYFTYRSSPKYVFHFYVHTSNALLSERGE
jgi:hypothetical protein